MVCVHDYDEIMKKPIKQSLWFDKDGFPLCTACANDLLGDWDYKRIAETDVGPYWISTVWLGLDHGFSLDKAPPVIFETMVFKKDGSGIDSRFMDRYASVEAAEQGHEHIVSMVRELYELEVNE